MSSGVHLEFVWSPSGVEYHLPRVPCRVPTSPRARRLLHRPSRQRRVVRCRWPPHLRWRV
eukprot:scaffold71056_cov60-Phaeocystis_antarctica.AAC.2